MMDLHLEWEGLPSSVSCVTIDRLFPIIHLFANTEQLKISVQRHTFMF